MSRRVMQGTAVLAALWMLLAAAPAAAQYDSEVPAGTRFVVELRDKLDAKKIKPGKKFEARTLEALRASDGSVIPAGRKLRGRVSYVRDNEVQLRFEDIDTGRGRVPILATPVRVLGEKHVKDKAGDEGEIKASGGRGKRAAIGAAVGGAAGAAIGGAKAGGKGAAIGAGTGAAAGAVIGAASGGRDLVLEKGTRLELELDRAIFFRGRR